MTDKFINDCNKLYLILKLNHTMKCNTDEMNRIYNDKKGKLINYTNNSGKEQKRMNKMRKIIMNNNYYVCINYN